MSVFAPRTVDEALHAMQDQPGAHLLAGGTDFMVEVNFGHRRPASVISLRGVRELRERRLDGNVLYLGAGVTYAEMAAHDVVLAAPALSAAARTVGSPQIRNTGTLGGNVGTGSPAGDTLPVLAALDASIDLAATDGTRRTVAWTAFFVGPKRTDRRSNELILGVRLPVVRGAQDYLKVGTRNAMVISVAGLALVLDKERQEIRCGLGSVGPVPLRAREAEQWVSERIDWGTLGAIEPTLLAEFGRRVADAASPIDDHRSTAAYRRHAVGVLARRAIERLLRDARANAVEAP